MLEVLPTGTGHGVAGVASAVLAAVNPATREVMAHVFATAPALIPGCIARAQEAARVWGGVPFATRALALARLRENIAGRSREIAETIACSMGKPLIEALSFEVRRVLDTLDACIAHATDAPAAAAGTLPALAGGYAALLQARSPRAVVCVIAPVSASFEFAMTPAVLALAAGDAVIVKTSSSAPLVGVLMERLLGEALQDFPGLAQVVHGAGPLGRLLAGSPDVDAVCFAGSMAVGRRLEGELSALQRPVMFELGGADALIVCDDANLERAANAAVFSRFSNNGQGRRAVKRVYVQRTVASPFMHKVMHKVRALKSGPFTNPFCELGPLANGCDLEHLRAVLQGALDQNAELLTGGFPAHVTGPNHGERQGAARQGWYWPPAVLAKVDHSMQVMKEPICGPILPIREFEDDGEAIVFANDTAFAFDASIFSADATRAQGIATGLRAGTALVNDVFVHGAKPDPQRVAAHAGANDDREPYWFPYSAAKLRAVELSMAVPGHAEASWPPRRTR